MVRLVRLLVVSMAPPEQTAAAVAAVQAAVQAVMAATEVPILYGPLASAPAAAPVAGHGRLVVVEHRGFMAAALRVSGTLLPVVL